MITLPAALTAYRQFILWKAVLKPNGKIDKIPVNPFTGTVVSAHDPAQWVDANTAQVQAELLGLGVGFTFTVNDPFFFLDIDNAAAGGQWSPLAAELCGRFPGAFIEVSYSGTGLHVIGSAAVMAHGCKNNLLDLELYTEGRFVALTGSNAAGDAAGDYTPVLAALVADYFIPGPAITPADWTEGPVEGYGGPADDKALIERALKSRISAGAAFGAKATFRQLWEGDGAALALCYPDPGGERDYDASLADMALCAHLAFWTGKDCARVDRLFRASELMREKWERDDYSRATILKVVGGCSDVYNPRAKAEAKLSRLAEGPPVPAPGGPAIEYPEQPAGPVESPGPPAPVAADGFRHGYQYVAPDQLVNHFAGCVYVRDVHKIFLPDGYLVKPDQFRAIYGGYDFALDTTNNKTTHNAYEAFLESQAITPARVHTTAFRPELAAGVIIHEEGRSMVNSYVPAAVESRPGDVTRFTEYVSKILPNENDQAILLAYMAACVQYPGVKFQWCPVIQGAEGNGKTILIRVLTKAIGERYTHLPDPNDLGNKFNGWLYRKLFIGVEEIHLKDRRELLDVLKPWVTNDRVPMQAKGDDQITQDNRTNWLMLTNFKGAIPITVDTRRYAIFHSAQQCKQDIALSGMGGQHFPKFYRWLRAEGYAYITHYLQNYAIPDALNPATECHWPPETSSMPEAVAASLGPVEQEILEAVSEGLYGFCGGWVSSMALDKLLSDRRRKLTPNKYREIMDSLGYTTHPHLKDGRVNNPIALDAGKPRLYLKRGHLALGITGAAEVSKRYQADQLPDAGLPANPASVVPLVPTGA